MNIPAGKGVLLDIKNTDDNIVAVNIIHALEMGKDRKIEDNEAYHIQCAQCAWPLRAKTRKAIQDALDRKEPVVVLAYRTVSGKEIEALGLADKDCDISQRRIIEAVFTIDGTEGMNDSKVTYGKKYPKVRTTFTLNIAGDELKDKYLNNRLPIPAYRAGFPLLFGGSAR